MQPFNHVTAVFILLVGLIAIPTSVRAAQSYDNCTGFIDSVPAPITTQGTWCLRKDLSTAITSSGAITILTNNVTIDCNDFKLGGLAAGTATLVYGIYAENHLNTTVRHCNIRGFLYGVGFFGSTGGGHVVEDSRFDGNTLVGVRVDGDGSVVRRNLVRDTGGSTAVTGYAHGILTYYAVDVIDNTVSGVLPTVDSQGIGAALGISTSSNPSGSIRNNRVRGLVGIGPLINPAVGIGNDGSGRISVEGNHIIGDGRPSFLPVNIGVYCGTNSGRARDNIVNGFADGVSNCRDEGNSL